jgi:hypothetical protein
MHIGSINIDYADALPDIVCQDSMVLDGDKRQALIGPD